MSEVVHMAFEEGGVLAPKGFLAAGVSAGIRAKGRRDVCVLVSESPAYASAVYTTNAMAAPPIHVTRAHLSDGSCRAVVINAGNANACTGDRGTEDARSMCEAVATRLQLAITDIAVASTGVIGVPLPMPLVIEGIAEAIEELDTGTGLTTAEAIMTTDTFPKLTAVRTTVDGRDFTVGGMAKGSGMIMPNMATMLGFVTTDAPLTSDACDVALRTATDSTFNRITVDGETSTNDMVLLMANGAAGGEEIDTDHPAFPAIAASIHHVCSELARMIVRDGEGATRFIEVTVKGAMSEDDAHAVAMSIANSPLFKTAIFGRDANWGRVAMAVGKSGAHIDPDRLEIIFAGILTCKDGTAVAFDEDVASTALGQPEIEVVVDLHLGAESATVWTCDLSYDYVRINGDYRT